jgi:hypothetical protein
MSDVLKVGLYVLLFLPGFIFVETRDYHLLRQAKGQFEKTLQVVLWSALIWFVGCALPHYWPFGGARRATLDGVWHVLSTNGGSENVIASALTSKGAEFFFSICAWSFLAANFWGILRKFRKVDVVLSFITGRDWYPSVAFKFFSEAIDHAVVVDVGSTKYIGILSGAPDNKEDEYITVTKVSIIHPPAAGGLQTVEPAPLVASMLIKLPNLSSVQALKDDVLLKHKHRRKRRITRRIMLRFLVAMKRIIDVVEKEGVY